MRRTKGRPAEMGAARDRQGERAMSDTCATCPYEMAYEVQFRSLESDLTELKERVCRLEVTLARGVMLLVANLACVVVMLGQQLLQ